MRGEDEWERIEWEEALDLIAEEIRRIETDYGPRATYNANFTANPVLSCLGGHVNSANTDSYGSWKMGALQLGTSYENFNPDTMLTNDRFDLENAETIVLYGCNPAWASAGSPSYHFWHAKEQGVNYVYVGPSYNVTAAMLEAKWIRVRPGTDTAFLLAVVYEMLRLDEEQGNIIDWDFLDRYTVGFDLEHLPEDAALQECVRDYVKGAYDDVPKTPEWASEICGTPVEDITWYAETVGKEHKVMLLHSYAAGRCNGAEDLPQLYLTVGAMGGHMGKSGHACGAIYQYEAGNGGPALIKMGATVSNAAPYNLLGETLPGNMINRAIVEGKYHYHGNVGYGTMMFTPGEWRDLDIKLIYSDTANFFQSRIDVNMAVKAYRKVDLVVSHAYDFTPSAQYADFILPVNTMWEGYNNIGMPSNWINRESMTFPQPVVEEPLFEAKRDSEIHAELLDRLGIDSKEIFPVSPKQQWFDMVTGTTVLAEDGVTWENLVELTQEDIDGFGDVTAEPHEGRVPFAELLERGCYQVPRHKGDNYGYIAYQSYVEDPEANPRPSASGKLELYCQGKADALNCVGYMEETYKPYPTYHRPVRGYEDSFADWETKKKGDYPYQMFTPHYLRRSHTTLDNCPWLREAFKNPIFLNADDAKEKGIEDGDTVLVWNEYGKILRHATTLESLMPGCVSLPHGSWPDIHHEEGIDYGGNENILTGSVDTPMPQLNGFNTVLVNYEKWSGSSIPEDWEKEIPMPEIK